MPHKNKNELYSPIARGSTRVYARFRSKFKVAALSCRCALRYRVTAEDAATQAVAATAEKRGCQSTMLLPAAHARGAANIISGQTPLALTC
jgi:hypothetical protein